MAQNVSKELKINYSASNVLLEEIFQDLKNKYDISFSYSTESILDKKKNCHFENSNLDDVLSYLLEEEQLEHKLIGNNVLLRKQVDFTEVQNSRYESSLHLEGKVVSEDLDEATFASVSIKNSSIGTYTDEFGQFDLEIPPQHLKDSLIVHSLGLEDKIFSIQDLEDEFLMVALNTGSFNVEEVVIVNRKKKIKVINALNSVSMDLSNNAQSGLGTNDISKNLQKLAGISASDDQSAEIKIRGSRSEETLIVLDGMPIYNCSHYYGIFNSINANYIEKFDVYKSYFPLQYGGKTGGIVELESKKEMLSSSYANIQMDLMSASSLVKLKLSDRIGFSLAGRSTIKDVNNSQFNTLTTTSEDEDNEQIQSFSEPVENSRSEPDFSFYDLNTKLSLKLSDRQSISINSFISGDQFENSFTNNIKDPNNDNELKLESTEREDWSNLCFSLEHDIKFDNDWKIETVSYLSNYKNDADINYEINKPPKMQGDPKPDQFDIGLKQKNEIRDLGLKSSLIVPIKKSFLRLGMEYIDHDIDYFLEENQDSKIRDKDAFKDVSFFSGLDLHPIKNLNIKSGLRATYFEGTEKIYYSPRILLNYKILESLNLKSSFGVYQQFLREFPFEYRGEPRKLWVAAGRNNIPVLKSQNWMVGLNCVFEMISIDIELYRKEFRGISEYAIVEPGKGNEISAANAREYELFLGNGFSRGIDITLGSGHKNYFTNVSYSLSETNNRFKEIDNNSYFPSEDDRRHQVKWINIFHWNKFQFGLDGIFLSGLRYTNLSQLGSSGSIRDTRSEKRFSKIDPYRRIDFSCTYKLQLFKHDSQITFSMLNVLDTKNEKYIQSVSEEVSDNSQDVNIVVGNESALMDRTWNISLMLEFGKK